MTKKELEHELAIKKDQCFLLYCVLYEYLEKNNCENVASRIEYLTSGNFADECERLKAIKNKIREIENDKSNIRKST